MVIGGWFVQLGVIEPVIRVLFILPPPSALRISFRDLAWRGCLANLPTLSKNAEPKTSVAHNDERIAGVVPRSPVRLSSFHGVCETSKGKQFAKFFVQAPRGG